MLFVGRKLGQLLISIAAMTGACSAATIKVVQNPYSSYDKFLQQYALSHHVAVPKKRTWDIGGNGGDDSGVSRLNINELGYDTNQSCDQLKYALMWEKAISIEGEIERSDAETFKTILQETPTLRERGCGQTVLLNSTGGDLTTALEIGRMVRSESRFVVVPDGGQCLSSCVFILFAARFQDSSRNMSTAVAFSNAVIGIHWPEIDKEDFDKLREIFVANPDSVFQFFGAYWNKINSYTIEMTGSTWLSITLFNSLSLSKGHMYVIDSAVERKLAGISTIVLPTAGDKLDTSKSTLRNICLFQLIEPGSARVVDSFEYELRRSDLYLLYYPVGNKVCLAKVEQNAVRTIVETYPVDIGSDSTRDNEQYPRVDRVRNALWEELAKVGLPRGLIGVKYGIGKAIEDMSQNDLRTDWGLYARLTQDYGCVLCGGSQGTIVFSNDKSACHPSDEETKNAREYMKLIRSKSFHCDTDLANYIYARMRFRPGLFGGVDRGIVSVVPILLQGGSVRISKKCPNGSGICSRTTGVAIGGKFQAIYSAEQE